VSGVDLGTALSDETAGALRHLLLAHKVLFFRDQTMDEDDHVRFARSLGEIDMRLFRSTSSTRPEVLVVDQVAPKGEGADSRYAYNTYMANHFSIGISNGPSSRFASAGLRGPSRCGTTGPCSTMQCPTTSNGA
jgi:alpha-ketoglutarate-dependent taurine dioxygenase